jgi:hypothetical protein
VCPIESKLKQDADSLKRASENLRSRSIALGGSSTEHAISAIKNAKGVIDDGLKFIKGVVTLEPSILACVDLVGCYLLFENVKELNSNFRGLLDNLIATGSELLALQTDLQQSKLSWGLSKAKYSEWDAALRRLNHCKPSPEADASLLVVQSWNGEADENVVEIDKLTKEGKDTEDQIGETRTLASSALDRLNAETKCKTPKVSCSIGMELTYQCTDWVAERVCTPECKSSVYCLDGKTTTICERPRVVIPTELECRN